MTNPRNAYQNYNCAVNLSEKTIYTYMGTLKPNGKNANYCSAGELSPLLNDPLYKTIGLGTKIFLGGGVGFVTWHGTQHNPDVPRTEGGAPMRPAGTSDGPGGPEADVSEMVEGDQYAGLWHPHMAVGLGIPIPILNAEMAAYTGVSNNELFTQVVDYAYDYPNRVGRNYGEVSYAQLMSGEIEVNGKPVQTAPLSSYIQGEGDS